MATGPGDELEAAGEDHLRASHADREQVIGVLQAAFVQGMLAKDEFDLRVGQAFASRTYAELAVLTADIPAGLAPAPPPQPPWAPGEPGLPRPGLVLTVGTQVFANWLDKRSAKQLPQGPARGAGGQAPPGLPSGGPRRQHPPAGYGRQHTAEAAERRLPRPSLPGSRSLRRWRPRGAAVPRVVRT